MIAFRFPLSALAFRECMTSPSSWRQPDSITWQCCRRTQPPGTRARSQRLGSRSFAENVSEHLARPGVGYDVVVISRPNNYKDCAEIIRSSLPTTPVVYDAEALFFTGG